MTSLPDLLYRDPLGYLDTVPSVWDGTAKFDLEIPRALYRALGNPQDMVPAIHVGGTNGKGTTCAYLAAMLAAAGFSVGHSSSPHLTHVTERCLIDGSPVPEEEFGRAIVRVAEAAADLGLRPSFFELVIGAVFVEYAARQLDWMVIEVGMGGRLDATNTMAKPRACVITGIGLDHMLVLGETVGAISGEKAGIFRAGVPVFVGAVGGEAKVVLRERAAAAGAPIEFYGEDFSFDVRASAVQSRSGAVPLDLDALGLLADHQIGNAALAVRVAQSVGLEPHAVKTGLRTARWPGRLEWFTRESVSILIDGAHNPDGVAALLRYLERYLARTPGHEEVVFLVSFLARKEWQKMLGQLEAFPLRKRFICTGSQHPQAVPPAKLAANVGNGLSLPDIREALDEGVSLCQGRLGVLVCLGSLYMLGHLRPLLTADSFRTLGDD